MKASDKIELRSRIRLLEQLCEIPAASGSEAEMKNFLLSYVKENQENWKSRVEIIHGENFQDCLMLKFGQPRTAIFAHMDSVGFTVRYQNHLLPIGSPDAEPGTRLVGRDEMGLIDCALEFDKDQHAFCVFGRTIERGTPLTYKPSFKESRNFIASPYLDNRLGIYVALLVAEKMKDGVIVFSTWEEHGGGSVPYLAKHIYEEWNIRQALVADITWVTDGVSHGNGVAISMRDRNIPRQSFVKRIIGLAKEHNIPFQVEVEGVGSSDGRELQLSPYPIDWCFIGAPEDGAHSPHERVHKDDIKSMIELYDVLMDKL
jgi:putative aminopeptidase FrvX